MTGNLTLFVGLPASGKSTFAEQVIKSNDVILLSSDSMRIELYGDVNHQDNNGELFQELYRRAKQLLSGGKDVIIDATNVSMKKRIHLCKEFNKFHKAAIYFNTPFEECLDRNSKRERKVPRHVFDRMRLSLTVPIKAEGWDEVRIVHSMDKGEIALDVEDKLFKLEDHDSVFEYISEFFTEFRDIFNLPQDTKYHTFSVSRHTWHVLNYIKENYTYSDKMVMYWAALLHDMGKFVCKNFKDGSRYANFVSHENVSGQIACKVLRRLGYNNTFILQVLEVVQLHMRLLNIRDNEKGLNKLREFTGEELFNKLALFREADTNAK